MAKYLSSDRSVEDIVYAVAKGGYLGAPNGTPGYAYGRVSGDDQADQGTGLERQLANISEVAARNNIFIPIEMIFLDDSTGFEFRDRPALSDLRKEYMSPRRRANIIVMEYIDRLSRNADWHQGFLLAEMEQFGVTPLFWKAYTSRIERAVMGAISQDGMELTKQRMKAGIRSKAEKGLVPAKRPAFGYMLVDSNGNPHGNIRKDTHYGINEEQAKIVRYVFEQVAYNGISLNRMADILNEMGAERRDRSSIWDHGYLSKMIRNTVYKGELVFGKTSDVDVAPSMTDSFLGGAKKKKKLRIYHPEDTWTVVPVPAIVSEQLWEAANRATSSNKTSASRNGGGKFLLTGMVKCADCGSTFYGAPVQNAKKQCTMYQYRCSSRNQPKAKQLELDCHQGTISKALLEGMIWNITRDVLLHPERILAALDELELSDTNTTLQREMQYLNEQLAEMQEEDQRLWKAYNARVFDEEEYAEYRADLKKRVATAKESIRKVQAQLITPEAIQAQKETLLVIAARAQANDLTQEANIDDETKKAMIKNLFSGFTLDLTNGILEAEGFITGGWQFVRDGKNLHIVGSLDYLQTSR
jgi:site-specific DNA recombinase